MRRTGGRMQGIQTWLALPRELEGCEPAFVHHPAASLPVIEMPGVTMRLIAGSAFDRTSPVAVASSMFYIAVEMEAGASFVLPDEYAERAVYTLSGDISINEGELASGSMAVLNPSEPVTIQALTPTRLMLLGGAPLDGERFLWWNFVASDRAAIEEASERWRRGGFDMVPGETEFIPLPDRPKAPEPFS
jgi:redox-sensitive bicupin YhaK (pirin superfamily)